MNQEGHINRVRENCAAGAPCFLPVFFYLRKPLPIQYTGSGQYKTSVNGGMDVKYGINESFYAGP
jgi:hypothetical protein